ncbi:MAG: methyltransferase domain-containing protein [Bdellovibrio sp.]|nr:methyltransferase domain-containing protein [Bdellovibrio sp.]
MMLNTFEKYLMNNPIRASIQRWYEAPLLKRIGGSTEGLHALEVGCGRGVGTQLILDRFGAATVTAFDLDPEMVKKAERRLSKYPAEKVSLSVGDVTNIQAKDGAFDAVFDFGIIHHVPDWRAAVLEITRVLKPGGRFFFEEVTRHALERSFYRTFLEHPEHDRFTGAEFVAELERRDLLVGTKYVERFFGDFVIGVAKKR